jgi:hypothetical protein
MVYVISLIDTYSWRNNENKITLKYSFFAKINKYWKKCSVDHVDTNRIYTKYNLG